MEKIFPEDVELIEEVKTLYKSPKNGKYYVSKERAQYDLATHFHCKCGKGIRDKYRVFCDSCEPPKPGPKFKDWDGNAMLYCEDFDLYTSEPGDIFEQAEENDIATSDLLIFICDPCFLTNVTTEFWEDIWPGDGEDKDVLPKEVFQKLNELNDAIDACKTPISWYPSKYRVRPEDLE